MSMVEKFKEGKKVMLIKMEQADKIAEAAAEEFVDLIESLTKNASEEELKEFLHVEDEMIDNDDKMATLAYFADNHKDIGVIVIGHKK